MKLDSSQSCSVKTQQENRKQTQTETQESPLNRKTHFCCEGGQIVERVAKRGCGVSVMEIQHLTGEGLEQPALADPALSKEIGLYDL